MLSTSTLVTLCCVTLFTYFGALTRMILSTLSFSSNADLLPNFVVSFFLANIHGSFVMGFFVTFAQLLRPNYFVWYVGVTTGYCGSCTTFSTWQRVAADVIVNGRVVDGLMTLLLTFSTSYMALICGKHIGEGVKERYVKRDMSTDLPSSATDPIIVTTTTTEVITSATVSSPIDIEDTVSLRSSVCGLGILVMITVSLTVVLWLGVALDTMTEYRQQWWLAAALGPIGSLARYWLLLYNRNWPTFPLFTFLANVSASMTGSVILVVYLRISEKELNEEWLRMYNLWLNFGVGAGVLGCFSTVSTFVNELHKLADTNILYAYRYGLLSIFAAQILCILIECTKFL